jgi:hypothetical protein
LEKFINKNSALELFQKVAPQVFSYPQMSSIQLINPNADTAKRAQALQITVNAAQGLQNVIKTNLGPKGTLKM